MSADCLFILRKAKELGTLRKILLEFEKRTGYGIRFDLTDNLLECSPLTVNQNDFVLFPCESVEVEYSELLLGYDDVRYNGFSPVAPLEERMQSIQELVEVCLPFSEYVEVYISDDDPCLDDYTSYDISSINVAEVLVKEYRQVPLSNFALPCVHLIVRNANRRTGDGSLS